MGRTLIRSDYFFAHVQNQFKNMALWFGTQITIHKASFIKILGVMKRDSSENRGRKFYPNWERMTGPCESEALIPFCSKNSAR